jgi:hypothetical protein
MANTYSLFSFPACGKAGLSATAALVAISLSACSLEGSNTDRLRQLAGTNVPQLAQATFTVMPSPTETPDFGPSLTPTPQPITTPVASVTPQATPTPTPGSFSVMYAIVDDLTGQYVQGVTTCTTTNGVSECHEEVQP